MTGIKVLAVASEIYPLVKTGGLADVVGALPRALRKHGVETVTLVPGYPAVKAALGQADEVLAVDDLFGGAARVLAAQGGGLDLFVLDAPHLFGRPGNPYRGGRWPRLAGQRVPLRRAGMDRRSYRRRRRPRASRRTFSTATTGRPGSRWRISPMAAGAVRRPCSPCTISPTRASSRADLLGRLRLPPHAYAIDGVEHYGAIGFLKAGLQLADRITTVSPTYAAEIQTAGLRLRPRGAVAGSLRRVVRHPQRHRCRRLESGDRHADRRAFRPLVAAARSPNKAELQRRFGLAHDPGRLLFGVVSRLAWHKGIDLLADAVPALVGRGAQLVVLGTGEPEMEQRLRSLADAHGGQIGCLIGYDEDLAHLIQAGSDAVLVPSRFEPCGLTQLCAMRYGAIPIGARVGGLADTIVDPEEARPMPSPRPACTFSR